MRGQGDTIELIDQPDHDITVRKLFDIVNDGALDDALDAMDGLSHLDDRWPRRLREVAKRESSTEED